MSFNGVDYQRNLTKPMKTKLTILSSLAGALILSSCGTTSPNVQNGALGGAVLGGVVGHQSGNALEGAAIGAAAGATAGHVVDQNRN